MARSYVSQVLKELKRQRRQIERAIAALEGIEQGAKKISRRKRGLHEEQPTLVERKNGTTGDVIPFVRLS